MSSFISRFLLNKTDNVKSQHYSIPFLSCTLSRCTSRCTSSRCEHFNL